MVDPSLLNPPWGDARLPPAAASTYKAKLHRFVSCVPRFFPLFLAGETCRGGGGGAAERAIREEHLVFQELRTSSRSQSGQVRSRIFRRSGKDGQRAAHGSKGRKREEEAVVRSGSPLSPSCGALTLGGNANARPGARVGADQLVASRPQPGNSTRRICFQPALRPFPSHRGTRS